MALKILGIISIFCLFYTFLGHDHDFIYTIIADSLLSYLSLVKSLNNGLVYKLQ